MPDTAREAVMTGGCQCGAVRYALYAQPFNPHICHCRMCQKAFGSYFAPLASVQNDDFAWTAGAPGLFMSSTIAERGFCPACGTPLSFRYVDTDRIGIAIGSLDDPTRVFPTVQYGVESRLPYFADLASLPGKTTEEDMADDLKAKLQSHQQGR